MPASLRRDPTVDPIAAGYAHTELLSARPDVTDRGGYFNRVTPAVGEAAAVGIDASVGDRRQKAVQQKTVAANSSTRSNEPVRAPGGGERLCVSHHNVASITFIMINMKDASAAPQFPCSKTRRRGR